MRPRIRAYYSMDHRALQNLGDVLVPSILAGLGYEYAHRSEPDSAVVNPGRCLLSIGSILTERKLAEVPFPADIWGSGWKGTAPAPASTQGARFFAVRGPETAAGLGLPPDTPLGDPALLFRHVARFEVSKLGRTVVVPHIDRVDAMSVRERLLRTGCDEHVTTWVWRPRWRGVIELATHHDLLIRARLRLRQGIRVRPLLPTVRTIVGADFVLTASLHGAILAQSWGIPWASYDDGLVDAPAKWSDWGAFLGVDVGFVKDLREGRSWWASVGHRGRIPSLRPLLDAFPFPVEPARKERILASFRAAGT